MSPVCLSVCNAVHCDCQGRCTGLKVVPSEHVPVCPFRQLCCTVCLLAFSHKTSRRKREREFFWDWQSGVHWSCNVPLFTDFVNFGRSRLSGLRLVAFIKSTRCIGSCVPAVRKLVTRTGLRVFSVLFCASFSAFWRRTNTIQHQFTNWSQNSGRWTTWFTLWILEPRVYYWAVITPQGIEDLYGHFYTDGGIMRTAPCRL